MRMILNMCDCGRIKVKEEWRFPKRGEIDLKNINLKVRVAICNYCAFRHKLRILKLLERDEK